jgi:hypothetical protein
MRPSIKTLCQIKDVTPALARQIRAIMGRQVPVPCGGCHETDSTFCRFYHDGRCRPSRIKAIDRLIGTHGVEYVPRGRTQRSPAFHYCNTGDSYAATIVKIGDRFRVASWGDLVERGTYE